VFDLNEIAPKIVGKVIARESGYVCVFDAIEGMPENYLIEFKDSLCAVSSDEDVSVTGILSLAEVQQLIIHGAKLSITADALHAFRLWCLLRPPPQTFEDLWRAVGVQGKSECAKNVCCSVHTGSPILLSPYRRNGIQHMLVSCFHCGNKIIELIGDCPVLVATVGNLVVGFDGVYFNPIRDEVSKDSSTERVWKSHREALLEDN
jgi:hypothetical protein